MDQYGDILRLNFKEDYQNDHAKMKGLLTYVDMNCKNVKCVVRSTKWVDWNITDLENDCKAQKGKSFNQKTTIR